ncbi:MAG: trypsin-like peptidase domain-containing protein [Ignavibacteriales bacterium]|nr:trypsin-like peptidase domain-containing protein [Ignavibacteriales bacterium]
MFVPLVVGFLGGYRLGGGSISEERTQGGEYINSTYYQSADRDSISQEISSHRRNAITRAVAMASPAVVGINVTEVREYRYRDPWSQFFGDDPFFRQFFNPRTYKQEIKSLGSGFIISPDGYIITNDHVAGNGSKITVTLTNKEKYEAQLIGTDPITDICLLKIDGKNFPYMQFGNSDDVIIGEWVIALGNPFGLFEISDKPTVTVGVISATGMNINAGDNHSYRGMIQTDASINSGNSGGPLINSVGEVIGVNSVIFTPNQGSVGVGFAVPSNRVKRVLDELKKSGKVDRDYWTGLDVQTIDSRVARYFGLDRAEGVIVSDVKRNSPASRAGFKVGDIIVEINNERITGEESINGLVADARPGELWNVRILREKQYQTLELKLERNQ